MISARCSYNSSSVMENSKAWFENQSHHHSIPNSEIGDSFPENSYISGSRNNYNVASFLEIHFLPLLHCPAKEDRSEVQTDMERYRIHLRKSLSIKNLCITFAT